MQRPAPQKSTKDIEQSTYLDTVVTEQGVHDCALCSLIRLQVHRTESVHFNRTKLLHYCVNRSVIACYERASMHHLSIAA